MLLPSIVCSQERRNAQCIATLWVQSEREDKSTKGSSAATPVPVFAGKDTGSLEKNLEKSKHFFGKKLEASFLRFFEWGGYSNVLLLGLGSASKVSPETVRQMGAVLYQAQRRERLEWIAISSDVFSKLGKGKGDDKIFWMAFSEGYLLASYDYRDFKKADPSLFVPKGLEVVGAKASYIEEACEHSALVVSGVFFARVLGDRPPNDLTPDLFAKDVETMAKKNGLGCKVLKKAQIEKEKMGLLLAVAQGSVEEPRVVILEHLKGKKSDKPIVLVGKGVTFDSGGLSLKPPSAMEDMKCDMLGAGAVAGIMQVVAALKLPVNVIGIIASVENMPSGTAQRPGDIQRSMTGKTVEVNNTDAEGRLILADAIEYAQKHLSPLAIIDVATLTGAVSVALGSVAAAIMGNHTELLDRMRRAGDKTGERVWELPLYDEYEDDLKSPYADMRNAGSRDAGSQKGGIFLRKFIDPKIPWVHCDIAGVAMAKKDVPYNPSKASSGFFVRLTVALLEDWAPLK